MHFTKLIVNPVAGAGKSINKWPEIKELLKSLEYDFDYSITEFRGHAIELAKSAANSGYKTIVSVGGDGTINEIVNGIYQSGNINDVILGIISTGTGADYIRTIGISRNHLEACKRLVTPNIIKVDMGKVGYVKKGQNISRLFINFAGMGFDAEIVKATTIKYKAMGSFVAYLMGLFTTLINYKNKSVIIKIDGNQEYMKICTVIVGQGKYGGGGMMTTPNADVSDGLFDVLIIGNLDKYDLLLSLPKIYKGTHLTHPKVALIKAKTIELYPDVTMSIQADGEILGDSPVSFQIVPSILNIAV
jgi:diacylglycerol kinase (ATP)